MPDTVSDAKAGVTNIAAAAKGAAQTVVTDVEKVGQDAVARAASATKSNFLKYAGIALAIVMAVVIALVVKL